ELQVSKPAVLLRDRNGVVEEPTELLLVDVPEEYVGVVTQLLGVRRAVMTRMDHLGGGRVRIEYVVPSRGLIGFRSLFLTDTRGSGTINALFNGYAPWHGPIAGRTNGAMVADRQGVATPYALFHLQERGILFIPAGTPVYEGMVVGEYSRDADLDVNVCREKKLTNMRASGHDEAVRLVPHRTMGLEEGLAWIDEDELVEVTPDAIRLRKRERRLHRTAAEHRSPPGSVYGAAHRAAIRRLRARANAHAPGRRRSLAYGARRRLHLRGDGVGEPQALRRHPRARAVRVHLDAASGGRGGRARAHVPASPRQ